MKTETYMDRVSAHDFVIKSGKVYFSALNNNGLYSYDVSSKETTFLTSFPNEKIDARHLHGAVIEFESKLYFAPMNGRYIAIYNIEKSEIQTIDIHVADVGLYSKYFDALVYKRKIIFIPSRAKNIIILDIDTQKVEFHSEWQNELILSEGNKSPMIKNGSFIKDDMLYMPYCRNNHLIKMSLIDFSVSHISINGVDSGFVDAIFDEKDNCIWLLQNGKAAIVKVSINDGTSEMFSIDCEEENIDFPYVNMIDMDKYIYLPSYQSNHSMRFDKTNGEYAIINLEADTECNDLEWNAHHYSVKKISDTRFMVTCTGSYEIKVVDADGGDLDTWVFNDNLRIIRMWTEENVIIKELKGAGLEEFLDFVIGKREVS